MQFSEYQFLLGNVAREVRYRIFPRPENDIGTRLETLVAVEGLLAAIVLNLATVYTAMFANRLGASARQIGLISSLPQLLAMFVLVPAAILAGRAKDGRKPVEAALLLAGIAYGLVGFTPFFGSQRVWFLIGMVSLANAPLAIYNAAWQNYFSDIVSPKRRNMIYTLRTSMTFFAGIVVIQLTGLILGSASSDELRIWLYQGCYWLAFIFSLLQLRVLRRSPNDFSDPSRTGFKDLRGAVQILMHDRPFIKFFLISILFHCGWYMAWPLFFLTQVHYLGANEAWLGYITVSASLLQWLTVKPWSRFIERRGVRLALVIGCFGLALNPVLAVSAAYLPAHFGLPVLLMFNLINASTFGAFLLSILQVLLEVMPQHYRRINLSLYTTALLLTHAIMPLLGVQLYGVLGHNLRSMTIMMSLAGGIRLLGGLLFLLRWYKMRSLPDCGLRE